MARGEKPTSEANATGMAFVAVFGVAALGAVVFVILTTRACSACDSWVSGVVSPGYGAPYLGADTAAGLLAWRDTSRVRSSYGAAPPLDGPAAHDVLERALETRGYLAASPETQTMILPADVEMPALEGACGVLEVEAVATSRLIAAGRGTSLRAADDPSVLALGVCGPGPFHIDGTGSATVRAHLMPGLVPGDVERTGLPEDVLVAHAEAETLLASVAYVPSNDVLRLDVTGSSLMLPALPEPTTGCVPWAVVVVGAGLSRGSMGMVGGLADDYATERALSLVVSCAGAMGGSISLTDAAGDGFVAWARPYGVASSPTLPSEPTLTIQAARVVDEAHLTLPASVPASPR